MRGTQHDPPFSQHLGVREGARRTFETPLFVHQEWPEHIARSCAAIRARKAAESDVLTRDGQWSKEAEALLRRQKDFPKPLAIFRQRIVEERAA
jgi:hypothetical protein